MCGLAGIIRYDRPAENSRDALRKISLAQRHRGPDGNGEAYCGHAALAHTRLALIDPKGGAQPLSSPDQRYTLVYNGEIYNFRELRAQLRSHWLFLSDCDSEVVLAAYVAWGASCLEYLNGMFSFFIWDAVKQEGFAARDALGIKPLVYRYDDGILTFASEAKAILAATTVQPKVNVEAVLEYFIAPYFSCVSQTPFSGIEILQPGCTLHIGREGLRMGRWYRSELLLENSPSPYPLNNPQVLAELVKKAVQRTMFTDAPVGVYLSGGLDSTLIAAIAQPHSEVPLPAYTINFENQASYDYQRSLIVLSDDTPYAIAAAGEIGLAHKVVNVTPSDFMAGMDALPVINDLLPAWEQEFAQYHLARVASRECKAILVGDAADETHYGYHFLLDPEVTASPHAILTRFGLPPLVKAHQHEPMRLARQYKSFSEQSGHHWQTPDAALLATTYLVQQRWLPRLLHNGDIYAMAFSLETRVPFGDRDLLSYSARIAPGTAFHNGTEKSFLREAMRGIVPDFIRQRKKSSLPKNQNLDAYFKASLITALNQSCDVLGAFLDIETLRRWCMPEYRLGEGERAHLFRAHAFSRWAAHYQVQIQ